MTKKEDITELLNEGYSVDDIITEMDVSTSYVRKIQTEVNKNKNDRKTDIESEGDNLDGSNDPDTSWNGAEVEGDKKDMGRKREPKPDKSIPVGGVTKRTKRTKQPDKEKPEKVEKETTGDNKSWKTRIKTIKPLKTIALSLLGILTLLMMTLLLKSKKTQKPPEQPQIRPRFPTL